MDLSIIIVNYNSLNFIKECIRSINDSIKSRKLKYEILVIDNNSDDGSVEYLKEESRNGSIRLTVNNNNLGFSRASNIGALKASGRYLLFLNPDTRIMEGRFEDLIDFYKNRDKSEKTGAAGVKILNPDGTLQYSARSFPTLARQFYESYFLYRIFRKNRTFGSYFLSWWDHSRTRKVDWLTGSFIFIKKEYFFKAGMFDEDYFMYSEDTDLCLKLKRKNFNNYYFTGMVIEHADSGIASREPAVREAGIWRSRRLYFKKNYSNSHALALSLLYQVGILNRIILFAFLSIIKPGRGNRERLISYFKIFRLYYRDIKA